MVVASPSSLSVSSHSLTLTHTHALWVLQVQKCRVTGKDYLLCDYNRDGDSYRSVPHTI